MRKSKDTRVGYLSKSALALILIPLLTACGSDDNDTTVQEVSVVPAAPVVPGTADLPTEKFDLLIEAPESDFAGSIDVYLGRWYPCQPAHINMCDMEQVAADGYTLEYPGVGNPNFANNKKYNLSSPDDSKYHMVIDSEDLLGWKEQAIRDDIFQPGHYSVLDLMLYISEQRDDFEVTLGEFNEERQTYNYTVSFDADGDGSFTNNPATDYSQWADYKDSDSWSVSMNHSGGTMLDYYDDGLETVYDRLDETLIRDQTIIRIMPTSPAYRDRMWQTQKAEVDFKAANGGKVMLAEITLDMDDTDGYVDESIHTIAKDIEVKAYNLRTDIYREGVITQLDHVISAAVASVDTGEADFGFTYWPTLSTRAKLGSYVMNSIDGVRAEGLDGWNYAAGMNDYTLDIILNTANYPNALDIVNNVYDGKDSDFARECKWLREDDGSITEDNAQICIDHWYGTFGGNKLHVALDNMVRNHGMEYIYFSWVKKMFWIYGTTELNSVNEERQNGSELYPIAVNEMVEIADISKAIAPLTEDHFGWNVADCGLCHTISEIHQGDSAIVPEKTQPYYCASCHGNNGAPQGHGETTRCFWCHSEDKAMANHGDASQWFDFADVECAENSSVNPFGFSLSVGGTGSCADNVQSPFVDKVRWNGERYNDLAPSKTRTRGNSDWHTSETFPDPYSCVTCHVNPKK